MPMRASQVAQVLKNPPANAGDTGDAGSIPGQGRSPGGGNHNLLQYSCLENHMERGVWWATAHRVAKKLDMTEATEHACMHTPSTLLKFPTLAVLLPFHQMVLLCAFLRPWKPSGMFFFSTCFLRVSALLLSWRDVSLS